MALRCRHPSLPRLLLPHVRTLATPSTPASQSGAAASSRRLARPLLKSSRRNQPDRVVNPNRQQARNARFRRRPSPSRKRPPRKTPERVAYVLPDTGLSSAQLAALARVPPHDVLHAARDLDPAVVLDEHSILLPTLVDLVVDQLDLPLDFSPQTLPMHPADARGVQDGLLRVRPPVITVMGHVDHGKTTLLDTLRNTNVAAQEAGGITQSVAAFQVSLSTEGAVSHATFIDTPGHAAFSAMRRHGASATDLVIVVVAADDGVQPQTREAIAVTRKAGLDMIVAINKCDVEGADAERVRYELLAETGINVEQLGGDVQCADISAKDGSGVPALLEMIGLQCEMMQLKANANGPGSGVCLESRVDRRMGRVATVVMRQGSVRKGDFVAFSGGLGSEGGGHGRVRLLVDGNGRQVNVSGPGEAVGLVGLGEMVRAGTEVGVFEGEREARKKGEEIRGRAEEGLRTVETGNLRLREANEAAAAAAAAKKEKGQEQEKEKDKEEMEEEQEQERRRRNVRELVVVVKGSLQGSAEAVGQCIAGLDGEEVRVRVVKIGVGDVVAGDVIMAAAGKEVDGGKGKEYVVAGLGVRVGEEARKLGRKLGVKVVRGEVIYRVQEEVEEVVKVMRDSQNRSGQRGEDAVADVRKVFGDGAIAGCVVREGEVVVGREVRVVRKKRAVFQGVVASVRRFSEEVGRVGQGEECGVRLEGWEGFEGGDILEVSGGLL